MRHDDLVQIVLNDDQVIYFNIHPKQLQQTMERFREYAGNGTAGEIIPDCSGMKPVHIEMLMGHSIGINNLYYKPTENELLQDYLKSEDDLTISHEKQLRREVEKLKVEDADIDIIKKSYLDMKLVVESKNDEVSRLSDAVTLLSDRYNMLLAEIERLKITKQ